LDVEDTVVDLREAAAVPTQLLRQPLAPIDTDLEREGQPRLHEDMHQAEIMVPVVEIQMRAPTFAGDQLQAPRLSIPAHPKRPAPFHALKDRNQPVAHAIARQNLAGAILFADLPRREILEGSAELLGHRASMRQQLGRQPLGKRAEVRQQDVLLIEPDLQPFPVANRPQRSAKSHAIKSCYDPGDAVLVPRHETLHRSSSRSMRCGKHIMPETGVERFTYSGAARYPPIRATEPQPLRGAHAVTFLPLVFDIATIWLRLRRAGYLCDLRVFVMQSLCDDLLRSSQRSRRRRQGTGARGAAHRRGPRVRPGRLRPVTRRRRLDAVPRAAQLAGLACGRPRGAVGGWHGARPHYRRACRPLPRLRA